MLSILSQTTTALQHQNKMTLLLGYLPDGSGISSKILMISKAGQALDLGKSAMVHLAVGSYRICGYQMSKLKYFGDNGTNDIPNTNHEL